MTAPKLSTARQFWLDHIGQCESETLTPAEYCKKHNLVKQRFYHYKSELRKLGIPFSGDTSATRFVAVKPVEQYTEVKKHKRRSLPMLSLNLTIKSSLFQLQFNAGLSS